MSQMAERRKHMRAPVTAGLRFFHEPAGREFSARSVDISAGGISLEIPLTVPVSCGQSIRLHNLPVRSAEFAGDVQGTIVRVDRRELTLAGKVGIGVKFSF